MKELKIACFGEVLWDVFPTYKKVGGAPLNVAIRLKSFSNNVSIISKIGDDDLGAAVLKIIKDNELNSSEIQVSTELKTGIVKVSLNKSGSAAYEIKFPSAWDYIDYTQSTKNLVSESDIFIFGSLIARHIISKNTLLKLISYANYKVFDLNLRAPYYNKELILELMNQADFIKLNEEEFAKVIDFFGVKNSSIEQEIRELSSKTGTKDLCVSFGENGAVLYFGENFYYNNGYQANVVDTVGSGDSFLATLINYLKKNNSPQTALDYACAVGALVAQEAGANPVLDIKKIQNFVNM